MLITRKKEVPTHWVFYAQMPFVMAIASNFVANAPILYALKKFIENPAAITFLLGLEVTITALGGPFSSWLSDRIWTRYGRRKPLIVISDIGKGVTIMLMPFAPDLWTLIGLRWLYGIVADIGSPNQPLTMEVVPAKQRGLGSGFFQLQLQIVNLVFWGVVIGRFDDVYFTGPFLNLLSVPGENLIFIGSAVLILGTAAFTWYGFHEVEPPDRKRLFDNRREGESVFKLFVREFFKDIFSKSLLPLYLLLTVGTLTQVGLGVLAPLLYTDQWGYSLQDMGTNVAITALFSIFIALIAGKFADATSKLKVYTIAIVLGLLVRCLWTVFVLNKPGDRPELWEILVFGQLQHVFGLVAGVVSFPLIVEYVERSRLGTVAAGQTLWQSLVKNGFTMLIGSYVLLWSIFFLPQAGDRLELVFDRELRIEEVRNPLKDANLDLDSIHLSPLNPLGIEKPSSRKWEVRRMVESAGDLHKKNKDTTTLISKLRAKLVSPLTSPDKAKEIRLEIERAEQQLAIIEDKLKASAAAFRAQALEAYHGMLATHGKQIRNLETEGNSVQLQLETVEPITPEIARQLETILQRADLSREADSKRPDQSKPTLSVEPAGNNFQGMLISYTRDPRFVTVEQALIQVGLSPSQAYEATSSLILTLRGLLGQNPDAFSIEAAEAIPLEGGSYRLSARLRGDFNGETEDLAAALASELEHETAIRAARVEVNDPGNLELTLRVDPTTLRPTVPETYGQDALLQRIQDLAPGQTDAFHQSLLYSYQQIVDAVAARPAFITVARPVVSSAPSGREYDYFLSVQLFMVITDFLALLVIALIVSLERKGTIRKLAIEEDAKR